MLAYQGTSLRMLAYQGTSQRMLAYQRTSQEYVSLSRNQLDYLSGTSKEYVSLSSELVSSMLANKGTNGQRIFACQGTSCRVFQLIKELR